MKEAFAAAGGNSESSLWNNARGIGLPFNFDSDLGGQGSALDIGFSFDPFAASEPTRIEGTCRPALEFSAFIGLQRFRPREIRAKIASSIPRGISPLAPSVACGRRLRHQP